MRKYSLLIVLGTILVAHSVSAVAANQDTTYVNSISGNDGNTGATLPCNPSQPCATIATALSVTNDPGLVIVQTSGEYAPFTITLGQGVSCPGVACIINGSGGTGVTINAPGKSVSLIGVSVFGRGLGTTGIQVTDVAKFELKNVGVAGFTTGLNFVPGCSTNSHFYLFDSEIRFSSGFDIILAPTSTCAASANITGLRAHHGNAGLKADATTGTGGISVVMSNSQLSFFNNNIVNAVGNVSGPVARIILDHVVVSHSSGNGVQANGATAEVVLSDSMVTQTVTPTNAINSGVIHSYGNNSLRNNTNPAAPTANGGLQ